MFVVCLLQRRIYNFLFNTLIQIIYYIFIKVVEDPSRREYRSRRSRSRSRDRPTLSERWRDSEPDRVQVIRRADDFRLVSELVNSALFLYIKKKRECIPVGCVPSAAVAVSGGCLPMGGKGSCLPRGVYTPLPVNRILGTCL